jgi:hypothetical protein
MLASRMLFIRVLFLALATASMSINSKSGPVCPTAPPQTCTTAAKCGDDGALQANALLAAWGVYYQTWLNDSTAYWFSTPEAWRIDDPANFRALMYQRARGFWEFSMEVSDPYQS